MNVSRQLRVLAMAILTAVVVHAQDENADGAANRSRVIEVERIGSDVLCTLVVEGESIRSVLGELAAKLDVELFGFEGVQRTALVTADLRRRPVRQALEFVLGSVGLRAQLRSDSLTVVEDGPISDNRGELLQIASAAYLRAQTHYQLY